jgi:uncharacterized protein (DUF1501 family)
VKRLIESSFSRSDRVTPGLDFATSRFEANQGSEGLFARGNQSILTALQNKQKLIDPIKKASYIDLDINKGMKANLGVIKESFVHGLSKVGVISMRHQLDSHDVNTAKDQPNLYNLVADDLVDIFQYLVDTPYDSKRSLFDVTTVMVTSEFSRTMRQDKKKIDETGTDHNPLNNTVLLAGKGI